MCDRKQTNEPFNIAKYLPKKKKKKSNCCQSIVISYRSLALCTNVVELKKNKSDTKVLARNYRKNKVLAKKEKINPIAISSLSCLAETCFSKKLKKNCLAETWKIEII